MSGLLNLDDLLLWYQFWRHFGEYIIIGGLAAEICLIALLDWKLVPLPDHIITKRRKAITKGLAAILILAGVGIEAWAGSKTDDIIARMRTPQRIASEQQPANVSQLAPRRFTSEQQSAIASQLRPLLKAGPERADVLAFPSTSEAVAFAHDIVTAMKDADWGADMGKEDPGFFGIDVSGVGVFAQAHNGKSRERALAAVEALKRYDAGAFFGGDIPRWPGCLPPVAKTNPYCTMILVIVGNQP